MRAAERSYWEGHAAGVAECERRDGKERGGAFLFGVLLGSALSYGTAALLVWLF